MLWLRYALLTLRPWKPLTEIYAEYLESPGTKAYSIREVRELFAAFRETTIRTVLTHGDLLASPAGQRHRGLLLTLARRLWPRWFVRRFCRRLGLFLLVEASK
jgi:hypothetical protein